MKLHRPRTSIDSLAARNYGDDDNEKDQYFQSNLRQDSASKGNKENFNANYTSSKPFASIK